MLYFKISERLDVVAIAAAYPAECKDPDRGPDCWWRRADGRRVSGWCNRNDFDSFMMAQAIADAASKFADKPGKYIAVDKGPDVSPRFDVIAAPQVGDDVSMYFNGDAYPIGKIVAIKPDLKRIVVDGSKRGRLIFIRRNQSAAWLNKGWSLVPGIRNDFNLEF